MVTSCGHARHPWTGSQDTAARPLLWVAQQAGRVGSCRLGTEAPPPPPGLWDRTPGLPRGPCRGRAPGGPPRWPPSGSPLPLPCPTTHPAKGLVKHTLPPRSVPHPPPDAPGPTPGTVCGPSRWRCRGGQRGHLPPHAPRAHRGRSPFLLGAAPCVCEAPDAGMSVSAAGGSCHALWGAQGHSQDVPVPRPQSPLTKWSRPPAWGAA